jgi:DNA-binding transcriptional ArsR family regulator
MFGMVPDYELADTVDANTPEKMRAIVDPLRARILDLVMDRAATVTELALALDRPKSSMAYHVDVLVDVGMLQVVRTRRVRAIEEKFYGRTGRTIVYDERALPEGAVAPNFLAAAIAEARPAAKETRSTLRHARISRERVAEFFDRVDLLAEEFTMLPREGDVVYGFIAATYPTDHPTLPEVRDEHA